MNRRGVLDELDEVAIWRGTGEHEPRRRDLVAVGVVDLEAVPMPLGHLCRAVRLGDDAVGLERRRVGTEPHRAAEIGFSGNDLGLVGHRRDDGERGVGIEFRRARVLEAH